MVALDRGHPDPLGSKRMELGSHIKEHRTELGLSQDDLAERIYVSRQTISNWECGLSRLDCPSAKTGGTVNGGAFMRRSS